MAAHHSSTDVVEDDLSDIVATPEQVREMIEADAQRILGITGDEFLAKVKAGEIVNDDSDSRITYLFFLVPYFLGRDYQSGERETTPHSAHRDS